MVSGCGYIGSEYGFLPCASACQMSDDHQSLLVGTPRKSGVTLGSTGRLSCVPGSSSPAGGTVTTKPAPTFSEDAGGGGGSGSRGRRAEGAHAAQVKSMMSPY